MDQIYRWVLVTASGICFQLLGVAVSRHLTPANVSSKDLWKWKNTMVSMVHALVTGVWAGIVVCIMPNTPDDIINNNMTKSMLLICISLGYFLYDGVDMLRFNPAKSTAEFMLHHFIMYASFIAAISWNSYLSLASVSLLVEINNIFLHARMLLKIISYPKDSVLYVFIKYANQASYLVFRIGTVLWMLWWDYHNHELIDAAWKFWLLTVSLVGMSLVNFILFFRLLQSDYGYRKPVKDNKKAESGEVNHQYQNGKAHIDINYNVSESSVKQD